MALSLISSIAQKYNFDSSADFNPPSNIIFNFENNAINQGTDGGTAQTALDANMYYDAVYKNKVLIH